MLDTLLLHPRTEAQLNSFIMRPSHGLILTGTEGAGKRQLAREMAASVLGISEEELIKYPYFSFIDPSDPTITIDEIRALQKLLQLRTPSSGEKIIRRVICIIDAGRMRTEAQNALP